MNVNLHILKEDLKDLQFEGYLADSPLQRSCSYPMLCTVWPVTPVSDTLYLVTPDLLPPEVPSGLQHISMLCIGKPADIWLSGPCNFLYTKADCTLPALMNRICRIFSDYLNWENAMQQVIDQKLPLSELAVVTQPLFSNPVYAQGASFRVIFQSFPSCPETTPLFQHYKDSYKATPGNSLTPEDINTLISDPEYNHAIEALEPTIYSGIPYGFRTLFYNVRYKGAFVARICFDEVVQPLTGRDFALIKVLGQYLVKGLNDNQPQNFNRPQDLDHILTALLEHRLLPEKKILSVLHNYHWDMKDAYLCMVLRLKTKDDTSTALAPIALALSQTFLNDCYTIYQQSIVFVCNLDRMQQTRDQLLTTIKPTLRDNLLSASISTVFHDFKDLYYYYQQAVLTDRIGNKKDPTKWYFLFEDYQMDYLLHKCMEKNIPQVMIPEGLQALLRHDAAKGSEYARLLRIYLDCERNIAETTRLAFIHRNTFHYRIQRIQEILQMDLDDLENRIILQIAFRLMDR